MVRFQVGFAEKGCVGDPQNWRDAEKPQWLSFDSETSWRGASTGKESVAVCLWEFCSSRLGGVCRGVAPRNPTPKALYALNPKPYTP